MKLVTTLRYGSNMAMVPGTGNYGGDLRLFFSTLNPADTKPGPGAPPSVLWQGGGNGAFDTYNVANGDVIKFNLNLAAPLPNQLYIYGAIQVTTAGITFGPAVGQGGSAYTPGQAALSILRGRAQGSNSGKQFDVGFEIAVPWDGIMADCHGQWWAIWR